MKKIVALALSIMTFTAFIFSSPVFAANEKDIDKHLETAHYYIRNTYYDNLSLEAKYAGSPEEYDVFLQPNDPNYDHQKVWIEYLPKYDAYRIRTSSSGRFRPLALSRNDNRLWFASTYENNSENTESLWKFEPYGDGYVVRNMRQPNKILQSGNPVRVGNRLVCQPNENSDGHYDRSQVWSFVWFDAPFNK